MKLKDCSDNDKRKELVKEFYSSLPHRTNHIPTSTELRSWMAAKQDICQVYKWHKLEYPVIWCWEPSWGWSYGSWIYNYLCNQFLSPLNFVSSNPSQARLLDTTLCYKVGQWLVTGQWFSLGTPLFSTNKTDLHPNSEIFEVFL